MRKSNTNKMAISETHTNVIEGHPIHTYFVETDLIHQLLEELNAINPKEEFQIIYQIWGGSSYIFK